MQVPGVHAALHRAVAPNRLSGTGKRPGRCQQVFGEFHCGSVEFVSGDAVTGGVDAGVDNGHRVAVSQGQALGEPRRAGHHSAHRYPVEIVDQIGQARALGMHRGAAGGQILDLLAHNDRWPTVRR